MTDEQFRARAIAALEEFARTWHKGGEPRYAADRAIEIIRALPCEPFERSLEYTQAQLDALNDPAPAAQGERGFGSMEFSRCEQRLKTLEKRQAETEAVVRDLLCLLMSHEKNEAYFYDFQQLAVAAKIAGEGGGR